MGGEVGDFWFNVGEISNEFWIKEDVEWYKWRNSGNWFWFGWCN